MVISMPNLEFAFYKKQYPELQSSDLKVDMVMTKWALSKNSKLTLEELNKAIQGVKKNACWIKFLISIVKYAVRRLV